MPDSRGIPYRYKAKRLIWLSAEMGAWWLYEKIIFPFVKDGWKELYRINARFEVIENELDYLFPPEEDS